MSVGMDDVRLVKRLPIDMGLKYERISARGVVDRFQLVINDQIKRFLTMRALSMDLHG
jgi:hypothetical protein